MRGSVAKIINKACLKELPTFKNDLKRTYYKVPRPLRYKFKQELIETIQKEITSAELTA
jgi:hypothetical protein